MPTREKSADKITQTESCMVKSSRGRNPARTKPYPGRMSTQTKAHSTKAHPDDSPPGRKPNHTQAGMYYLLYVWDIVLWAFVLRAFAYGILFCGLILFK